MTTNTPSVVKAAASNAVAPNAAIAESKGMLAAIFGKEAPVPLAAGQGNKIKAQPGRHLKLVREQPDKAGDPVAADNVIATQQGDDLVLRYADGTTVRVEGFFTVCADAGVCSVNLPGDAAEGVTLSGDSARGVALGEDGTLLYAHGAQNVLMKMAQNQSALTAALTGLGDSPSVTYAPASDLGGGWGLDSGVLGFLGVGVLGGAGGGGTAVAATVALEAASVVVPTTTVALEVASVVVPTTTITGVFVAGPVQTTNDLTVYAFKSDGTQLASSAIDAYGNYTLSFTSDYTGAVLLKVASISAGLDYWDEATGAGKNLDTDLYAVVTVDSAGESLIANVTPLTDLAAKNIGLANNSIIGDASASAVAAANIAIAKFFGLTTADEQIIELLAVPVLDADGAMQISNLYGQVLAIISAAEVQAGQSTGDVLATLGAGIDVNGATVSFREDADGMAAQSLLQEAVTKALQSGVLANEEVQTFLRAFQLNGSTASPQVFVYADKGSFKADETATVYFKLSAVSADFDAADIVVAGGTLGTLELSVVDPTVYTAMFTPAIVNNLSGAASIWVDAGAFTSSAGGSNTASGLLSLNGDTLLPGVEITDDQNGVAGGDITYTFTFSEPVIGFTADDVTVGNGSKGTFTAVSAITYTMLVTPDAGVEGNVTVSVAASAAQDAIGNNSTVAVPTTQAFDTLAPTVEISDAQNGVISNSGNVSVQSNEIGTAYLVRDGISPTTVANITGAADGQWNSVAISTADTATNLSAAGLVDGVYHVYAADAAGNLSQTSSAAVTLDSTAPTVTNMAVLDGVSNLSVTSDIVLTFGAAIAATTDGHIQIINDANDTAKNGYETETTAHTINLYLGTSATANGVTTWTAFQDTEKTIASGSVSIDDVTGVVTINPLYDLDLSNNYHVEISANTFHKVSNGLGNEAFGAAGTEMNFSTVSPGDVVTTSGDLGAAAASVKMTSTGATQADQYWVSLDVAGLGSSDTALKHLDLSAKDYAVVMKDNASATEEFGVLTSNFFGLGSYAAGDTLYFDRQINDKTFSAVDVGDTLSGGIQTAGYTDATHMNPSLMYFSYDTYGGQVGAFAFTDAAADADVAALAIRVIIA